MMDPEPLKNILERLKGTIQPSEHTQQIRLAWTEYSEGELTQYKTEFHQYQEEENNLVILVREHLEYCEIKLQAEQIQKAFNQYLRIKKLASINKVLFTNKG